MKDVFTKKIKGRNVIIGCRVRNVWHFTHKGINQDMSFKFILN